MKKVILGRNKIAYRREGKEGNPRILFLHGTFASSKVFTHIIELLSQDFDILVPDFPGFGLSEKLRDKPHTIPQYSSIIAELCDYLDFKPFYLIGSSLGGMVGIHLTSRYPDYVSKLVVQGTPWNRTCYTLGFSRTLLALVTRNRRLVRFYGAVRDRLREGLILKGVELVNKSKPKDEIKYGIISYNIRMMDAEAAAEIFHNFKNRDLSSYARKIKRPSLVIVCENDRLVDPLKMKLLSKLIKDSRLEIIEGGTHDVFEEEPEKMRKVVNKFLIN